MDNAVIIIGISHHNGLGLVRSFGLNGIKPYGIIIDSESGKSFLQYSRYWENTWKVKDEDAALEILRKYTFEKNEKPVVIPCSDGTAKMIDEHLYELSEKYILPSIDGKQGEIASLMDKSKQTELAKKLDINAPETEVISLVNINKTNTSIQFPVIIKPVESAEGDKCDITVCKNLSEYQNTISKFLANGYSKVLVQHYFSERHEYMTTAAIADKQVSFSVVSNIRQWPLDTGSGSFAELCTEQEAVDYVRNTLEKIADMGYSGPLDMEFFKDSNGNFYLTEFNWRSSGRNYVSLYNHCHSAYFYYCVMTGKKYKEIQVNTEKGYLMNVSADVQNVIAKRLSFGKWWRDVKMTKCFALEYTSDLKPVFFQYVHYIKKFFCR